MNPNQNEHWRSQPGGPSQQHGGAEAGPQQQVPRPFGGFGATGQPQGPPVLPPPPQSFHHPSASGNHSLSIADLTQGPQNQQPQYNTAPPPSHQNSMGAALNHQIPHLSPPQYMSRERELREIRDREIREHELREREMQEQRNNIEMRRQQEENILRERDAREREQIERMQREQQQQQQQQQRPVQSHTGSIPIHQPVATNIKNSAHGPNGLLSNGGSGPVPAQQSGPPPSSGPNSLFSMHTQAPEPPRQYMQHQPVQAPAPQPAQGFMGGPSPMTGQAQLAHGQQPILNDALSYLDQVKVRFSEHPDVYNRFLDIMKDFKSQAIDTPGVIERVSNLFNGHPALIQGFNTFLPPGYRIECGTDDNPDAIRVTTPSGTMTQSLQSRPFGISDAARVQASQGGQPNAFEARHGWGQTLGQQMSPSGRAYDQQGPQQQPVDPETANRMHQQEQQGVSQLTTAVSAATNGINRPAQASPGPQGAMQQAGGLFGMGAQQRGPVEFNHAISYVNKIKNRFAQQPDIYKQFLEILQTYQRESKPIGDVYAQVTQLFRDAPDLLEDFKQFLPESAAHAKQLAAQARASDEAVMNSNVRGEAGYGTGQIAQAQTPRPPAKMPPMGQFDPPSTSKENKKRRAPGMGQIVQPALEQGSSGGARGLVQVPNANKRQKISSQRPQAPEPAVSPTLIPQLPEPLAPTPAPNSTQDELGFFDRAKKYIGNRASYAEFMKLINLFSNDLIDKHALCDRVGAFLAGNAELMRWFTDFLGIEEQEEIIEARSRPDPGRVNLSMCRSLGPSYRHLPKRDQNKPCKGRDPMCNEVLNDVWASHPTWASEDSGFIAHRKNQYEETMHRIEEERHDYDFHIEACQRTIQLMEPIVQQFKVMSEHDLNNFQLARGLGGASEAIPKRIIMKVYGREYGAKVMNDLFANPTLVLPVLLDRLKKKLEEWKHAQREWERIWREQIHKNFWKSLDHQGINARNLDKKNFQPKTLTSEVHTRYEERHKSRDAGELQPKWQLEFFFKDEGVIKDALALAYCGVQLDVQSSENEKLAMTRFMEDFVSRAFDIDRDQLKALLSEQDVENGEVEASGMLGDNLSRNRRGGGDSMRRLVMERKIGREGSVYSGSRASTPAPITNIENEVTGDPPSDQTVTGDVAQSAEASPSPQPWTKLAQTTSLSPKKSLIDEVQEHVYFNLYANANLYCFFRLFEMLYSRLLAIKENEQGVHEAIYRWNGEGGDRKAAIELRMTDRGPDEFFEDISPGTNFYAQVLRMCRQVLQGGLEMSHLEELLRRYYNKKGWQLYAVERLVNAIVRAVSNMHNSESKDKSLVIADLFFKDRLKPDTTMAQEVAYRKQSQKLSKDGDIYRITFTPSSHSCTVRLFPPEDSTFDNDDLSAAARYQYYMACYPMRETTEGVDVSRMLPPFLRRNLLKQDKDVDVEASYKEVYGRLQHYDDQEIVVNEDTYRMSFTPGQTCMFSRPSMSRKVYTKGKIEENEKFVEKFVRNTAWMKDQRAEDVERRKAGWERGLKEGIWRDDGGVTPNAIQVVA